MKKTILKLTGLTCLLIVSLPLAALAAQADLSDLLNQAAGREGAGFNTDQELAKTGLASLAGSVARAVISFLGVVFMAYIIYGGFLWMTAAGNEEHVSKARKIIRDGIIGLIVVLSAAGIYVLVINVLLGNGATPDNGALGL